jgi:hypothetical protein
MLVGLPEGIVPRQCAPDPYDTATARTASGSRAASCEALYPVHRLVADRLAETLLERRAGRVAPCA